MLKFKREDVGLYFALGLVGGGIGLLIGAFVASRIEKKLEDSMAYLKEDWEAPDIHMASLPEDEDGSIINPVKPVKEEKVARVREVDILEMPERTVPKSGRMAKGRPLRLTKEEERELDRLISEYIVSPIQIELVRAGTMTTEDLEIALIEQQIDDIEEYEDVEEEVEEEEVELVSGEEDGVDVIDYSKPYRIFADDKPDMDDLLPVDDIGRRDLSELLVTIGGRYEIMLEPPEGKHQKHKRTLFFDEEDERVYQQARSGSDQNIAVDIGVMMSPEVKDTIWDFLLFEDVNPIYINDLKGARWYSIEREEPVEVGSEMDDD